MEGMCIVVTPLIALMKDQVDQLTARKIKAAAIHSGMTRSEIATTLDNCIFGDFKFLYVSPERLGRRIKRTSTSYRVFHLPLAVFTVDHSDQNSLTD